MPLPLLRRGAVPIAASALLTVVLVGCGGGSQSVDVQGVGVNPEIRLASCTDWNASSTDQRLATVNQLENFATGPIGSQAVPGRGAKLDTDKAYDLFENACKPDYARAFKLYKLYERAAAFAGN